jgi:hypothetical protein
MKNSFFKTTGTAAFLVAAATLSASATVEVPNTSVNNSPNILTVDGYVAVAGGFDKNNGRSVDGQLFDAQERSKDAVHLGIGAEYQGLHAYADALYQPEGNNYKKYFDEAGILEAYVGYKWKSSSGEHEFKVQAGKFITYLGYESFHTIGNALMTGGYWANDFGGLHSGIRADYKNSIFGVGGAIVDSLGNGRGFYEGDGDLHNIGFELFVKFTPLGDDKLTIFTGIGYDPKNDEYGALYSDYRNWDSDTDGDCYGGFYKKQFVLDIWASYKVNDNFNFGGEFLYESARGVRDLYTWILFGQFVAPGHIFTQTDQLSLALRLSGARRHSLEQFKFSVGPTYTFNENLSFRLEASFIKGDDIYGEDDDGPSNGNNYDRWYIGAQVLLKF